MKSKTIKALGTDAGAKLTLDEEQLAAVLHGCSLVVQDRRRKKAVLMSARLPHWRKYVALTEAEMQAADEVAAKVLSIKQTAFAFDVEESR